MAHTKRVKQTDKNGNIIVLSGPNDPKIRKKVKQEKRKNIKHKIMKEKRER